MNTFSQRRMILTSYLFLLSSYLISSQPYQSTKPEDESIHLAHSSEHSLFTDQAALTDSIPSSAQTVDRPSTWASFPVSKTPLSNLDVLLFNHHINSLGKEKRLIVWGDGHEAWITEGQKAMLIFHYGRRLFVDVTELEISNMRDHKGFVLEHDRQRQEQQLIDGHGSSNFPEKIQVGKKAVAPLIGDIRTCRMKARLTELTQFRTRYYRSATGRQSQSWLLALIRTLANESASNLTITEFLHPWRQNSIIVRFEPNPASLVTSLQETPTLIIGSHQDSTNLLPFLPAPGADDDGSGTVSTLEALSVLLQHDWQPSINKGAVEFMFYSAEEGGLLGSQSIAKSYKDQGRKIMAMLQLDMTAFVKMGTEPKVGLITDFVDPYFNNFLKIVIGEYLSIGHVETRCGYACSDHASWNNLGVPAGFVIESKFEDSNPHIHSIKDKPDVEGFSVEHMAEFTKLVVGTVVELTGADA